MARVIEFQNEAYDTFDLKGAQLLVAQVAQKIGRFAILENTDVSEPAALKAQVVNTTTVNSNVELRLNILIWLAGAILLALAGSFLYLNSSINDTRRELQQAMDGKSSEALVLQVSQEAAATRRHMDMQLKSVQAQIKSEGDSTRDKLEQLQRTIGRLESK
ncbi:hypothetical protein [Metapseudomonas otitidis]|uniref:Uncharacterized protein n=1 Tax=Metapseudomonas otitidis TaxID=319939 RepID=A0A679GU61_9GAMM|nr:hypothetical protein [Pseudomonas otitidis]BCA30167.1 hypothetical protein PtoMrB4_41440 [Pseudomonas otitidis]